MENNNKQTCKQNQPKTSEKKEPVLGNKIELPQDTTCPRNLQVDKPVWAAYANMARQNIYQTLCHISHVIGLDVDKNDPEQEENLLGIPAIKILNQKGKAEIKAKSIKMLESHFPFLEPMIEKMIQLDVKEQEKEAEKKQNKKQNTNFIGNKTKTPGMYYEVFTDILPLINLLRNYYSHHVLIDHRINAKGKIVDEKLLARCHKLVSMLDYCMTGARRIVKDRFTVGENATFKKSDFEFFEGKNRYYDHILTNEEGFAILDDKSYRQQTVKREKKSYIYKVGIKNENERYTHLTNMGIYLLLCLFLNKKYAKEFGDKIDFWGKNFKNNRPSDNVISIMHETSCVYSMHLPKDRLHSEKDSSAVGLDMLNELKKCPKELFETLSAKDQEKFRVDVEDRENEDGNKVLMLRSFDRFPVLALQYLDSMHKFDRIRFQVDLGNYRHKFYEKKNWIDKENEESQDRVRVLQKELTGYGRISEIEQQRKERWKGLIRAIDQPRTDSFDSKPYITDHHASYHIENNNIGLQWNNTKGQDILDKSGIFMPSTDLPDGNSDSKTVVAPLYAPKCHLSIYDLPAVCFLTYLSGSGSKAEELIICTTEKYLEFFRALGPGEIVPYNQETKESLIPVAIKEKLRKDRKDKKPYNYIIEPYGIDVADLPRKVQDYILGDSTRSDGNARFRNLSYRKLDEMYEYTKRKLELIKENRKTYASKDNKLGKKSHVDIRQGSLARFLAKDMVFFKKPDEEGRVVLTSQNFDVLQKELALFDKSLSELRQMFVNAELIGCKNAEDNHPFLQSVIDSNPTNFLDFYISYLQKREKYLEKCKESNDYSSFHFLHPDRAKWQNRNKSYYRELMERYTTVELPGNLFLDAIVEELKKIDTNTLEKPQILADALARDRKNVAFLINAYMQATGNGYQPFYDYKRAYKYFAMTYHPEWDFSNPIEKLTEKYLTVGQMEQFINSTSNEKRENIYRSSLEKRNAQKVTKAKDRGRYNKRKRESLEKELQTSIGEAHEKLRRRIKEYKDTEKEIRRVKVQDAVLFMMAKDVLTSTMGNADLRAYRLKYVGNDKNGDILSMQLPFSIKLQIPVSDGGIKEVTIRQGDLKLKNYGDFFRFIYDSRIRPLLTQLEDNEIDRQQLEMELDNYDMNRVPLFRCVHELESRVCGTLTEEQFHRLNDDGKPVKVDFKYLLEYVNIKESNKELLRVIRNAFCHSTYPDGTKVSVVFEKEQGKHIIPEIAKTLVTDFATRSKSASPKQKTIKK